MGAGFRGTRILRKLAVAVLPALTLGCVGTEPASTGRAAERSKARLSPAVERASPVRAVQASESGVSREAVEPAISEASLETSLGELVQDGPPTPEQISLYLPIEGALDTGALAKVRYEEGGSWREAHPLFRIRPEFSVNKAKAPSAFAGVVTGLQPNRQYRIEVTISLGSASVVKTLSATTRALPAPAGASTKTVRQGASASQIQALLDGAVAGDVIQFENGTYEVDALTLKRGGKPAQPVYVRGQSRGGVKLVDRNGRVLYLVNASHVVIENLTLEGSGTDSGTAATSEGIRLWNGYVPQDITVRNVAIQGVDKGIVGEGDMREVLVYDNTLVGNDVFRKDMLESNISWNDDGIRVPGRGHAVFNNTLSGFGDALAMSSGTPNIGVHFYRNRILFTNDDAFEGDYGTRNVTFHDNRVQNAMTLASFDPIYSGPAFVFRNVAINVGRQPYKLNNTNTGMFIYNNTVVRMHGFRAGAKWGWVQNNNGSLRAWGYRNNVLVSGGTNLLAIESTGNNPIDFTNNAWYPDGAVWWSSSGGSFRSLSAARARLRATNPVFGTSSQRHEHDVISASNPFETAIRFGESYDVPVTTLYEPVPAADSVLKGAGVAIPGVTDEFAGPRPDIGAVIAGRPPVVAGDRMAR